MIFHFAEEISNLFGKKNDARFIFPFFCRKEKLTRKQKKNWKTDEKGKFSR